MKALITIVFLITSIFAGCKNMTPMQEFSNEYNSSLARFDKELVNHFPREYSDSCVFSTNAIVRDTLELVCFDYKKAILLKQYSLSEYIKVRECFDSLSKTVYLASDSTLLVLFPYCDKIAIEGVVYDNQEVAEKQLLAKHNLKKGKSLPVPLFEFDMYHGNSICGLSSDFKIFVLDAMADVYDNARDNSKSSECLPKEWLHGYSKGVALSDEQKVVIYWIAVW